MWGPGGGDAREVAGLGHGGRDCARLEVRMRQFTGAANPTGDTGTFHAGSLRRDAAMIRQLLPMSAVLLVAASRPAVAPPVVDLSLVDCLRGNPLPEYRPRRPAWTRPPPHPPH